MWDQVRYHVTKSDIHREGLARIKTREAMEAKDEAIEKCKLLTVALARGSLNLSLARAHACGEDVRRRWRRDFNQRS